MSNKSVNLSASFPVISVSGALKGPIRANLAASFPEFSVSGTLKGPLRANLSAIFPEISVSGTLKGPLSVNLSPSFPEINLTGRLVNQSKIVRRSLTLAYDANIVFVLKTVGYGNAVVLNSRLLTPYQSYVTSSRNIVFSYDLPEYFSVSKSLTSTWFSKAILSNILINAYENSRVVESELISLAGFCITVEKSMLAEYEQLRTVGASVLIPYALTYPVTASVGSMYDLLSVNKVAKSLLVPATFEGDINAYFAQPPNASIIGLLGSIDPIRMEVSTSITESVWQVNAQIPYDQSPKAILGERAIASFNALSFSVEFAGKSRSVNVSSDTVNIEAYSPTRSLAFEPAPNFSGKKAIRTLKDLGVNDVIGLADSDIKNTTANQTKLSLINAIAADMGAALMSDPSAKLNVMPSWKASGQQWTVNEDMILEYNEVFVDGPAYNRIVVSDSNSIASGLRTEVVKDEANVDDWLIYVYGGVNVSVSHTQEYGSITPLGDQVLIKSEQVELINGVANLGYEATALISVDWLHNQINSPLSIDGQRLLCGSDGDFALVKVDYSVKATVFKLTYSKDEPIQLVIKGD